MLVVDGIVSYEEWEKDPKAVITRYSISLSLNEDGTGYMKNATDETEIIWDDDYITIEGERMSWYTDGKKQLRLQMDDVWMIFLPAVDNGTNIANGYEMTDPKEFINTNKLMAYPYSIEVQEMWTETPTLKHNVLVNVTCEFTRLDGIERVFSGESYSLDNDGLVDFATTDYDYQTVSGDAVFVTTLKFEYPSNSNTDFSKMTLKDDNGNSINLGNILTSGYAEDTTYDHSFDKEVDDFVNDLDDAFQDTLNDVDEYINGGGLEDDLDEWFYHTFGWMGE